MGMNGRVCRMSVIFWGAERNYETDLRDLGSRFEGDATECTNYP
jgi:hypothetical protein